MQPATARRAIRGRLPEGEPPYNAVVSAHNLRDGAGAKSTGRTKKDVGAALAGRTRPRKAVATEAQNP
jgi:hypothetical protein